MISRRDELEFTIAFALAQTQRSLPRPGKRATGWPPGVDDFRIVAAAIVRHLELSGYELRQRSPRAGHRTP